MCKQILRVMACVLIFLAFVVFPLSVSAMELSKQETLPCGMVCFTKGVARDCIQPLLSYQEIARLKRTSRWCDKLYDVEHLCPLSHQPICSTYACKRLAENYYVCTKALAHFARTEDREQFKHLWIHHEQIRNSNVATVVNRPFLSVHDQMIVYEVCYGDERRIKSRMLESIVQALRNNDLSEVRTVLSAGSLHITDLIKNYESINGNLKNCFSLDKIIYQVCQLNSAELLYLFCGKSIGTVELHYIMQCASSYLIDELFDRDMLSTNIVNQSGKSVLHYAAQYGFFDIIKKLLARGMYVNCRTCCGMTPLHYAAQHLQLDAVMALFGSADIDPRLIDDRNKTALDYVSNWVIFEKKSKEYNRAAIKQLLKDNMRMRRENSAFGMTCKKSYGALR